MTPTELRRAVATRISDTGLLGCGCCQYGDRREDADGTSDSIAADVLDLLAELGLVEAPAVVDPVAAALALHRSNHAGECVVCTHDDCDAHHLYPCPTALALGVEPTEGTARP